MVKAKRIESIQPGLFDAQEPSEAGPVESLAQPEKIVPESSSSVSQRVLASLTEQIARDEQTLRLGPNWWIPSREFFVERVASYRAAALAMDARG